MYFPFKGVVHAMTAVQQINGKNGVMNKCTIFVAPTMFNPNTGEPTFGTFEQSLPVEVLGDEKINEVQQLVQGQAVSIVADLRGRSNFDQNDQSLRGFLSLSLVRCTPETPQVQPVQQPTAQPTPQPAPVATAQPAAAPFPFPGSK